MIILPSTIIHEKQGQITVEMMMKGVDDQPGSQEILKKIQQVVSTLSFASAVRSAGSDHMDAQEIQEAESTSPFVDSAIFADSDILADPPAPFASSTARSVCSDQASALEMEKKFQAVVMMQEIREKAEEYDLKV